MINKIESNLLKMYLMLMKLSQIITRKTYRQIENHCFFVKLDFLTDFTKSQKRLCKTLTKTNKLKKTFCILDCTSNFVFLPCFLSSVPKNLANDPMNISCDS